MSQALQAYADPRFGDAGPRPPGRLLRLRSFEILIFVIMAVLFAMCLCAAPLVAGAPLAVPPPGPPGRPAG